MAKKITEDQIIEVNKSYNSANTKALTTMVGARVIEVDEESIKKEKGAGKTNAAPHDPFRVLAADGKIVEPPFDMLTLAMLPEHNTELGPVVEAMEVNIEGFGHRFIPRIEATENQDVPDKMKEVLWEERVKLENFFMYVTDESFIDFRKKGRKDTETTGNRYFEVIRNAAGEIQQFYHLPSYQMRLGRQSRDLIPFEQSVLELQQDKSVEVKKIGRWKRFRTYAQSRYIHAGNLTVTSGTDTVWFKELGDPRKISKLTGNVIKEGEACKEEDLASEMVHICLYSPRSPYGLPRFIGNLLSIFGDRSAEEINFMTFKNNNIPSMVVCVSNGQLTDGSIDRMNSFVESQIQGSSNYSKFLIIEAEGEEEGEDGGQVKVDIKPLAHLQKDDALFQNYSRNNQDKIRRCFRMPPIFVGKADEIESENVDSSRKLADEQIFSPERCTWDEWVNRILFPQMGIVYHKYRSNSPNTTDNSDLVKIMANSEKTGGMTPRIARSILEEVLGKQLPPFPKNFPSDLPFSMTMAEAVKNQAEAVEPGQQVTALKKSREEQFFEWLVKVKKNYEGQWIDNLVEGKDCCEID